MWHIFWKELFMRIALRVTSFAQAGQFRTAVNLVYSLYHGLLEWFSIFCVFNNFLLKITSREWTFHRAAERGDGRLDSKLGAVTVLFTVVKPAKIGASYKIFQGRDCWVIIVACALICTCAGSSLPPPGHVHGPCNTQRDINEWYFEENARCVCL